MVAYAGRFVADLPIERRKKVYEVEHDLDTEGVIASVHDRKDGRIVKPDDVTVRVLDGNNVRVTFRSDPGTDAYRLVLVG